MSVVLQSVHVCKWAYVFSDFPSVNNGVIGPTRGMLSPLLFNLYMNGVSMLPMKLPTNTTVSHLMYADDTLLLLAASARGLQILLDVSDTYGCGNDIYLM